MPAWPLTLPQALLIASNVEGIADGRLRSETDTGPGKMRRRSSAMGRPLAGSMLMTTAQLDILQAFVADDLVGGTLVFTFPKGARGDGEWSVRIGAGMPSWVGLGGDNWQVSLSFEIIA